jgi:hypothetical protein
VTTRALATRIFVGLIVVVLLVGGTIWMALNRSSSADRKASTSRVVNVEQRRTIERNKRTIARNTRKLNATLVCLARHPEPLKCVRKFVPARGRGAVGGRGLRGAAGGRGTAGARGTAGGTGTTGERGATGDPGETGLPGIPGVAVKGDKGDAGRDGADGLSGVDGPRGPEGPRGPAPSAIQTMCPGPDGEFFLGFATDPDGDLTYTCP